jgi:D-sedoheptulose 7-phosphate isomerase
MDAVETYLSQMEVVLRAISRSDVRAVVNVLFDAWERRATTYLVGNGGSAATASHMMNDLNKFTCVAGRPRFRAVALTDNVPLLTAVANDLDYAAIFAEPIANLIVPGDVLVAISGSGNSPNITAAVEAAKDAGALTIGLCGSPGGTLALEADLRILIPSDRIGQQEDGHLILNHAIACALRERILATGPAAAGSPAAPAEVTSVARR